MVRRRRRGNINLRRRMAEQNQIQYMIEQLQDYIQNTPSYLSDAEVILKSLHDRAPYLNKENTRELLDRIDAAVDNFRGVHNSVASLTMFANRLRAREDEYYD